MSTGYRPPSKEVMGRWGRHIHAKRREWGWSQTRGFEAVREQLGLSPKSRAAYIPLDEGRRPPTPKEEAVLLAVYGPPPDVTPDLPQATEPPDALVAAIRAQSETISALLVELQAERQARVAWEQGFLEAMRELATGAARQADPELVLRGDVRQ